MAEKSVWRRFGVRGRSVDPSERARAARQMLESSEQRKNSPSPKSNTTEVGGYGIGETQHVSLVSGGDTHPMSVLDVPLHLAAEDEFWEKGGMFESAGKIFITEAQRIAVVSVAHAILKLQIERQDPDCDPKILSDHELPERTAAILKSEKIDFRNSNKAVPHIKLYIETAKTLIVDLTESSRPFTKGRRGS